MIRHVNDVAVPSIAGSLANDGRSGPYPMGLMSIIATVAMLFAAFTAALLMRRTGIDWIPVPLPRILWVNALVLIASSGAVEGARSSISKGMQERAAVWLGVAACAGLVFLGGQVLGWNLLAQRGVFLPTSPHGAFFYMLSAVHGAHVVGGLVALSWTLRRAATGAYTPGRRAGLTHAAIYWHFVGAVWIYLLVLLSTL